MLMTNNKEVRGKISLIPYIGGKHALASILSRLIDYTIKEYGIYAYRELMGGGGHVLLNLPSTNLEVRHYNDLNTNMCALLYMVSDFEGVFILQDVLHDLGVSREVYQWALANRWPAKTFEEMGANDRLKSATIAYILSTQSYAASLHSYNPQLDWSDRQGIYYNRLERLPSFAHILSGVEITNEDAFALIERYGNDEGVLLYLDPPYVPESMLTKPDHYGKLSWSAWDHERFAYQLSTINSPTIVSGYDNRYYKILESYGWQKLLLKNKFVSSSATSGVYENEYIWINFGISESLLQEISIPLPYDAY
jgi:site-specific DNA-adenine methylase